MKHPRYVMTDEEGDMALASDLMDMGLTEQEATKAVKEMKGGESLQEIANKVLSKRSREAPPKLGA